MQFTFESRSKEEWLTKVTADLKGRPIKDLDWEISEMLIMSPFAHSEDSQAALTTLIDRQHNTWYINEDITVGDDISNSNALALSALQSGVTSLSFKITSPCDFKQLFEQINLEWIFLHLEAQRDVIIQFIQFVKDSPLDTTQINCSFNLNSGIDSREILKSLPLARLFVSASDPTLVNPEEEIAALLVRATTHLQASRDPKGNAKQIYFSVNLTDSFYINIAKIRALKLLWANILHASEIPFVKAFIKAHMSINSFSEDVDYTKIKAAAQGMSAAIASVDMIHIPPSSQEDKVDFHTRIAR